MDFTAIIFGILGGFFAGIINIISGSGSIITLSLMAFFNVPADIANGTNRIGILTHGIKGSYSFFQKGQLELKSNWMLILFCLFGSLGGTITAIYISPETFNFTLGIIFCCLLFVIVFEPQKYLKENKKINKFLPLIMIPIGFYGGFIQVATGIFILSVLHILSGVKLQEINPLKVFIIMLFNIPALILFTIGDKINWPLGIALAVGQYFGAIIGVRINDSKRNIEPALKALLIVLMASIGKFWGWY